MPFFHAALLTAARKLECWAVGYKGAIGSAKPVVFHRRSSGNWEQVYDGTADYDSNHDVRFVSGVRNRDDPAGLITVRVSETWENHQSTVGGNMPIYPFVLTSFSTANYNNYVIPTAVVRSIDGGETWSPIAIAGSLSVCIDYDPDQGEVLNFPTFTRPASWCPDLVIRGETICSPAPGVVLCLGSKRSNLFFTEQIGGVNFVDYWDIEFGVMSSVDGAPFSFVAGVDFRTWKLVGGAAHIDVGTSHDTGNTNNVAPRYLGQNVLATRFLGGSFAVDSANYRYDFDASSFTATASLPDMLTPQIPFYDGRRYLLAGLNPSSEQQLLVSSDLASFTEIFSGGTGTLGPAAGRSEDRWLLLGKGVTVDGGANWATVSQSLTKVKIIERRRYLGVVGRQILSSRDGVNWRLEFQADEGITFLDVFG